MPITQAHHRQSTHMVIHLPPSMAKMLIGEVWFPNTDMIAHFPPKFRRAQYNEEQWNDEVLCAAIYRVVNPIIFSATALQTSPITSFSLISSVRQYIWLPSAQFYTVLS